MKTPVAKRERAVGIFLALGAAILVVVVIASVRRTSFFDLLRPDFVMHVSASEAFGVAVGAPVKLREVDVGAVTGIDLVDDPKSRSGAVRIDIHIRPEAARFLGDGTIARIVRPPLGSGMPPFGTSTIELLSVGDKRLPPDSTIASEVQESFISLFGKAFGELPGLKKQAESVFGNIAATLDSVRRVADALAKGDGAAGKFLRDPETGTELVTAVHDARGAMQDLRQMAADMKIAASKAPGVADGAERAEDEARRLMTRADQLFDAVTKLMQASEHTLGLADDLINNLKSASKDAPVLARKLDSSIDEANRLIEGVQRNFLLRGSMPDRPTLRTQSDHRASPLDADGGLR